VVDDGKEHVMIVRNAIDGSLMEAIRKNFEHRTVYDGDLQRIYQSKAMFLTAEPCRCNLACDQDHVLVGQVMNEILTEIASAVCVALKLQGDLPNCALVLRHGNSPKSDWKLEPFLRPDFFEVETGSSLTIVLTVGSK